MIRFTFVYKPELCSVPSQVPCRALFRGFMMPGEKYGKLYSSLKEQGVTLVTTPQQYESVHYYPNAYPHLAAVSPRAVWVPVPDPDHVQLSSFDAAVAKVTSWKQQGCSHVVLKDYVKSAKFSRPDLLHVAVDRHLARAAAALVRARGMAFNRGVVFKERIAMAKYAVGTAGDYTNEWRLWLGPQQEVLALVPNSEQVIKGAPHPPDAIVQAAQKAAKRIGAPFVTVDFGEGGSSDDGDSNNSTWFCLEAGAGSVSGPAVGQDLNHLWRALATSFQNYYY